MLASEENRRHKVLVDGGTRLKGVVSDVHGQAAREMIKAVVAGREMSEVLDVKGRLCASSEELFGWADRAWRTQPTASATDSVSCAHDSP